MDGGPGRVANEASAVIVEASPSLKIVMGADPAPIIPEPSVQGDRQTTTRVPVISALFDYRSMHRA